MTATETRIEHDLLGDLAVPADAYYGVQTARALENFQISGVPLQHYPNFIKGFAMVKLAAARANFETGGFSKEILTAIEGACQELIDGKLHDQFQLDVYQGGAGTSTNMTETALKALTAQAKKGVVAVRSSRVTTGLVGRNVEVDDDKNNFVASLGLNPQKARVLLRLALLKTSDPKTIQRYFDEY